MESPSLDDDLSEEPSTVVVQTIEPTSDEVLVEIKDIAGMTLRTKLLALLVIVLGLAGSSLVVTTGVKSARNESKEGFDRRALEMLSVLERSWGDYERLAAATHDICRPERNTTREGFREYYEYVLMGGIDLQAIQCVPNITHAERPAHEAEAKAYWESKIEDYNYTGIWNLVWSWESMSVIGVEKPGDERPFYFPIHYLEPLEGNEGAIDLNLWSDPVTGAALMQQAIDNYEPVLSGRTVTQQETDKNAYSVIIYHTGVPLSTDPPNWVPDMFSIVLVRIHSLLERVGTLQEEDLGVYLFDEVRENEFLGAAHYRIQDNGTAEVSFPAEIDYESLKLKYENNDLFFEESAVIASGTWRVVVLPIDNSYDANLNFIIFGGVMIIVLSVGIALWMHTNVRRITQIYRAKLKAEAEHAIVANLFPENVRQRLVEGAKFKNNAIKMKRNQKQLGFRVDGAPSQQPADVLTSEGIFGSKPIADFHPEATLMFLDLVGFTAWSSQRSPDQVFTLLEVLYNKFDEIALQRDIFKVETVGDCYVAACGVPNPRHDHAVRMSRFASDCMQAMPAVLAQLEVYLGPGTAELSCRVGLHSGAVTSGVLRGDKGRFQLFGDTLNTASRMESTGVPNMIQVSPETAQILKNEGKDAWLVARDRSVFVKGKGDLETYWLNVNGKREGSQSQWSDAPSEIFGKKLSHYMDGDNHLLDKHERLINWNVEELTTLLKKVVARRGYSTATSSILWKAANSIPLDEVKDVVSMPEFDTVAHKKQIPLDAVELDSSVVDQLTLYVRKIGCLYHSNPFHNFEHASHVALSVTKLLSRIVNPKESCGTKSEVRALHDHTFGITSDPLTQFAAFFAAMIHDVDHRGVTNAVLIGEAPIISSKYRGTSVAEQNSIDIAWDILMSDEYKDLRRCICPTMPDLEHFRQLVVQLVMSTDIMDTTIGGLRKKRWDKAFAAPETIAEMDTSEARNRKATIVMEHLIQASDVSHTMQHWHIYRSWNQKLFFELYHGYKTGKTDTDPSTSWYEGELGFFDFYVIPLAKKLDTCGVFGVSSDEFLIYATGNRQEWALKGNELVEEYLEKYNSKYDGKKSITH